MTANIIRKRYTRPYTPHIETCRTTAAAFDYERTVTVAVRLADIVGVDS